LKGGETRKREADAGVWFSAPVKQAGFNIR